MFTIQSKQCINVCKSDFIETNFNMSTSFQDSKHIDGIQL